jgi:hypothetical protein
MQANCDPTTYYIPYVNSPSKIFPISYIGGQIPASIHLAPNLAFRYGIIPIFRESHHT